MRARKELALKVIQTTDTITNIAKEVNVSRKFVHAQKAKALSGINAVFEEANATADVLYSIPVTKNWIKQFVLSLIFDCRSSFRGIIKALKSLLDYEISIGTICNILKSILPDARVINGAQNLSGVKTGAHDEIFNGNKPVLTGVDSDSLYCYLLSQEQHRDGDTWAITLWDLKSQEFNPERVVADDGDGLRLGHHIALPDTPCDQDHFHIIKKLIEMRRFFRNRLKSSISYTFHIQSKMEKAKEQGHSQRLSRKLGMAMKNEKSLRHISQTIDTLVNWMTHDVLNLAGASKHIRLENFDFIVEELMKIEKWHPHRIASVRVTLQNQRESLFSFVDVLESKFEKIAQDFSCAINPIVQMGELMRCHYGSAHYAIRSLPLQEQLGDDFDSIEDAVLVAMQTIHRTSGMVENFNSRLKPYFYLRREIGNGYLDLLQFYLNHSPFMRSSNPTRVNKSAAEVLNGKSHPHWLEMLGFTTFKRAA